jgi:hypothetical protein
MNGKWLRAYCSEGASYYDFHGLFRAYTRYVPSAKSKYYQRVKLILEYAENGSWHAVAGGSKTRDSGTFKLSNLPTYTTPGIKTSAGLNYSYGKIFRFRAVVKLKHVLPGKIPDTTTWRYQLASNHFTCNFVGKS